MNLYFNDKTLSRNPQTDLLAMTQFLGMYAEFAADKPRSRLWTGDEARAYLCGLPFEKKTDNYRLLLSLFHSKSAINDEGVSEADEKRYLSSKFSVVDVGYPPVPDCEIMGWAEIQKEHNLSLTFGICGDEHGQWGAVRHCLLETTSTCPQGLQQSVLCATLKSHLEADADVRDWIEQEFYGDLQRSDRSAEEKMRTVKLSDDHDKDVLKAFARRLVRSPYVEAVLGSIPMNSQGARDLISNFSDDGCLELRLYWEKRGPGLRVKTTGRNRIQTRRIADILRTKFSQ